MKNVFKIEHKYEIFEIELARKALKRYLTKFNSQPEKKVFIVVTIEATQ
jgi:hypothetical protein